MSPRLKRNLLGLLLGFLLGACLHQAAHAAQPYLIVYRGAAGGQVLPVNAETGFCPDASAHAQGGAEWDVANCAFHAPVSGSYRVYVNLAVLVQGCGSDTYANESVYGQILANVNGDGSWHQYASSTAAPVFGGNSLNLVGAWEIPMVAGDYFIFRVGAFGPCSSVIVNSGEVGTALTIVGPGETSAPAQAVLVVGTLVLFGLGWLTGAR